MQSSVSCSLCGESILKGERYSITEYGSTHGACLHRAACRVGRLIMGSTADETQIWEGARGAGFLDPIHVYRRL